MPPTLEKYSTTDAMQFANYMYTSQQNDEDAYKQSLSSFQPCKTNVRFSLPRYSLDISQNNKAEINNRISLDFAQVWLEHQSLWKRFSISGNEMIITRTGRRMFPVLTFGIYGLNPTDSYKMEVEVIPSDNSRYKFVSVSGWRVNGIASQQEGNKRMVHPDAIQIGEYWHRNGIAFKRIKLTNKRNAKEGSNQIVLNSMHKYYIQLVIKCVDENEEIKEVRKIVFKDTAFIAVTAYQNGDVTQLKIDHNPFAKAFRESLSIQNGPPLSDDMYSPKRRKHSDVNYVMSPQFQYCQPYFSKPRNDFIPCYQENNFAKQNNERIHCRSHPIFNSNSYDKNIQHLNQNTFNQSWLPNLLPNNSSNVPPSLCSDNNNSWFPKTNTETLSPHFFGLGFKEQNNENHSLTFGCRDQNENLFSTNPIVQANLLQNI